MGSVAKDIGYSMVVLLCTALIYYLVVPRAAMVLRPLVSMMPKSKWNNWSCSPVVSTPGTEQSLLARIKGGNVSCMATEEDDKNCIVFNSKAECEETQYKNQPTSKELQCGLDHLKKHGFTGYDSEAHWCNYVLNDQKDELNANSNNPPEQELVV